jgi:hypothetical protein
MTKQRKVPAAEVAAVPVYVCQWAIDCGTVRYEPGELAEFAPDVAARLLESGAIVLHADSVLDY